MVTLTFRVPDELAEELDNLCKEEDRTRSWFMKRALQEKMEDYRDYQAGIKALSEHNASGKKTHSIESVAKEFGVRLERKKLKKAKA